MVLTLTQPARPAAVPVASPPDAASVYPRVRKSASTITTATGCRKLTFHAMGTACHITIVAPSPATADTFINAALTWVANFEAKYSRFIPDSLIGRINSAAGHDWVTIDPETERLLDLCADMIFFTGGAFDPTALPLIRLWNWKAQPPVVPDDAAIAAARQLVGWKKIQRRPGAIFLPVPGMCLDFGGIGKEYAVDCVAQLAAHHGVRDFLVDFGQDIRAAGAPPGKHAWHIGLENPNQTGSCWNSVAASNVAIATSGDYLRYFEKDGRRYGHILDPRTGYPAATGCRAVTIIAPSCTVAGILSTTAFVLGPEAGLRLIETCAGADGCILTETNQIETRRFQAYVTN